MNLSPGEKFARSEIAIAYTLLWGACLHDKEEDQRLGLMHATAACRVAEIFAGGSDLQHALTELKSEIANWSKSRCNEYRIKSYQLSAQTLGV